MAAVVPIDEGIRSPSIERRSVLRSLRRNNKLIVGVIIFLALALTTLIGSLFVEPSDRRTGFMPRNSPPSLESAATLLGSTSLGQSISIQMTQAVPNSILVGLIAATIGTVLGAAIGLIAGYFGGPIDAALRILIDVFLSVPSLLFLVLIASILEGVSVMAMALIIGIFAWAWPARAVRSQALTLRERPFVRVARLNGEGNLEIIFRELLPHMLPWLGANFLNAFIVAILAESGLSILGLGPQREMTLGMMIYWSVLNFNSMLQNHWWWWLTPVITLMALFLSLYLIHLGLDEVANPRKRARA
jgi:peptide/nickel transport system permease protein